MNLSKIHSVYFLGIGGIGMSALARWFNDRGLFIQGYDRVSTPLTKKLESEGIDIHYVDDPSLINNRITDSSDTSLIIYTPAIPEEHIELNFLRNSGHQIYKRSQVLGMISADNFTVAVAGTHGKTSTSSMIAHILHHGGKNCAAFVGGIMTNYGSNLILPKREGEISVVVEADEFDRSFLQLYPDLAVITAADPDHLDIYGSGDQLRESFRDFISQIKSEGTLFIHEEIAPDLINQSISNLSHQTYGIETGDISAQNIRVEEGVFRFDYHSSVEDIKNIALYFPGRHNIKNAVAAISIGLKLGLGGEEIKSALASYKGVKRRFEYISNSPRGIYIDDYAHHPEEIRSFIGALRELYPDKKITVVFQPHLFTRTRDFAKGFAESLDMADEVILMPIYPAREKPIEGVNSEMIRDLMSLPQVSVLIPAEVLERINSSNFELLATVGAGDIDQLVEPIRKILEMKSNEVEH